MKLCKQKIQTKESINSNGLGQFFDKKVEIEKNIFFMRQKKPLTPMV